MKFIFATIVLAAVVFVAYAEQSVGAEEENVQGERFRKSAYGGAAQSYSAPSYSAPAYNAPCPKNYLFSCQPNLQPVACQQPAYGSAGAYSENIPRYLPYNGGYPTVRALY